MKQQPNETKMAFQDPLYSIAILLLMAAILFIVFLSAELFQSNEKSKQVTIGGSFLLGEAVIYGKTQD